MKPARVLTALWLAVACAATGWVLLDLWTGSGRSRPPLSWANLLSTGALPVLVVAAGLPVRRWVRRPAVTEGQPVPPVKPIDPLVAARTAVLAKAAAYGGALLVGWYLAQAGNLLPDLVGERRGDFVIGLLGALEAVLLVLAGFVVQRWCRVPPEDTRPTGPGDAPPGG